MADDQPDMAAAEADLHDAIAEILGRQGRMVTKWILATETIGADGVRDMEAFASPDYRAWDSIGMLGFLSARERGVVAAEAVEDQHDDDGPDGM